MDVHVIDEEDGISHGDDATEDGEPNNVESSVNGLVEPKLGMEFDSDDLAKTFYDEYARHVGFSPVAGGVVETDGTVVSREFVCSSSGREGSDGCCAAMVKVQSIGRDGKWVLTKCVKDHTHSIGSPGKVHHIRPRKHFAGNAKSSGENVQGVGVVPTGVVHVSVDGKVNRGARHGTVERNRAAKRAAAMNYVVTPMTQKRTLGRDAQNLLEYLKKMQAENPGFFYAIQLDEDNRFSNVFWADARSRTAYTYFGDAVTFDTNYRLNQWRVPFAPFTGVNHHGQTILFGCALLLDDSEASFVWLFRTFLTAMNDRRPVSIITDQDRAIRVAVSQVFHDSRHCISQWHVLREGQRKLAYLSHVHPNFQVELYNCINMTDTIEEFESSWISLLDKYNLRGHEWLQSIYEARAQWVPVYFRDSFLAVISQNQGFQSSFLDGYVNQQTALPLFFRQYERALENWFEREVEADFETICTTPVLKTPSPMEKQAADRYTRKVFVKFQEELVETFVYTANRIDGDGEISMFRVAKYEDDQKAYTVTLNHPELRANCSCRMFEYSGILCRHILTVFTVTNVLTLPSHYILKRWTRTAKAGTGMGEHGDDASGSESLTLRYNNLCREAINFAEEGAVTGETYNVAMASFREAGKQVAVVKKNVAKVAPTSSQGGGGMHYDERKTWTSDVTPLLWPGQDEITRRFNLNNNGAAVQSVADLNLPRMASLQRDDGASGNTAVLPCLKSMTWMMENKNSAPANRVAVINLKLQDYSKIPSTESEVKFQLSSVTLEPMLKSMAYISEQLSTPANRVAVINLKLQDTETISGESEVKFQVSRDTLGAMLRSMAYIREQLSNPVDPQPDHPSKKQRK